MLNRRSLLASGAAGALFTTATPSRASGIGRELLTTSRIYYVRTDGNDGNDGLSNTPAGAFRTPQRAWDEVSQKIDIGGQAVTINISGTTYSAGITDANSPAVGGRVLIIGDPATPSNVGIANSGGDCFEISGSMVTIRGIKMSNTNGSCIHAYREGVVNIENVEFGACNEAHIFVDNQGQAILSAGYRVSGPAPTHWLAHTGGLITGGGRTITFIGTPNFSNAFAYALRGGIIENISNVYSGAVTGIKFVVDANGTLYTGSNDVTLLPGTLPGQILSGTYGKDMQGPFSNFDPTYQGRVTAGSTSYSQRYGRYYKNGQMVFVTGTVTWTNASGSGQAAIGNLPFPAVDDAVVDILYSNLSVGAGKQGKGYVVSGENCIAIYACDPAGGPNASVWLEPSGEIRFTATYLTYA